MSRTGQGVCFCKAPTARRRGATRNVPRFPPPLTKTYRRTISILLKAVAAAMQKSNQALAVLGREVRAGPQLLYPHRMSTPAPSRHQVQSRPFFTRARHRIHQSWLIKTAVAVGEAADAGEHEKSAPAAPRRPLLPLKMANWEENVLTPPSVERWLMCAYSEEQPSSHVISSIS